MRKIMCDQMLGSLASWLRFIGVDTFYATNTMDDETIMSTALKENRVLITRDKELIIRAQKKGISVIPLFSKVLDEQLKDVISHIDIEKSRILTRCSLCNSILNPIKKEKIKNKVPEKVYLHQSLFWECPVCDKIYWKGSHYDNILKKIQLLQQ